MVTRARDVMNAIDFLNIIQMQWCFSMGPRISYTVYLSVIFDDTDLHIIHSQTTTCMNVYMQRIDRTLKRMFKFDETIR